MSFDFIKAAPISVLKLDTTCQKFVSPTSDPIVCITRLFSESWERFLDNFDGNGCESVRIGSSEVEKKKEMNASGIYKWSC